MPGLRRFKTELDQYSSYSYKILDNVPNHVQNSLSSTNCPFIRSTNTMERHKMNAHEHAAKLEPAYFTENLELLSTEKSTNERDLQIEVLDMDQLGIFPDTKRLNNEKFSNSVDGHLSEFGETFSSSPIKNDESMSTNKTSDNSASKSQVRKYKCHHCGLSTKNPREYLHHLKDSHKEQFVIYECDNCEYASKYFTNFQRHRQLVHKKLQSPGKFQCDSCNFNTTSNRILIAHIASHNQTVNEQDNEIIENPKEHFYELDEIKTVENESNFIPNNEKIEFISDLTTGKKKNYKCPLCKMNIRFVCWMIRHLRTNHRGNLRAEALASAYEMRKRSKRPNNTGRWRSLKYSKISKKREKLPVNSASKWDQTNSQNFGLLSSVLTQSITDNYKQISSEKSHMSTDKSIRCDICYQRFKEIPELEEHMKVHLTSSTSNSFTCNSETNYVKGKKYDNFDNGPYNNSVTVLRSVRNELDSKNTNIKYKCPYCPFRIGSVSRFHIHFVQHMKNLQFICSDCDYHSNWKWTVVKHIWSKVRNERNHFNASVLTNNDLVDLNSFKLYKKYLVNINQSKPVNYQLNIPQMNALYGSPSVWSAKTNVCLNDDTNSSKINTNPCFMSGIASDSPKETNYYYCKECSFKSASKQIVINHLSSHTGIKAFQCSICDFKSDWKYVTVRHIRNVHFSNDDVIEHKINYFQEGFVLSLDSVFNSKDQSYEDAEKVSNKVFSCQICPYKSSKEFHLNFHMRQHKYREGANFICDKCPYFVKFPKYLIKHQKLHSTPTITVEQSLTAKQSITVNNKSVQEFQNSINVEKSPKKCFRKKPFSCSKCPARFSQNDRFSRHLELHGKNYKFKCDFCDFSVAVAVNLLKHKRLHEMDQAVSSKSFACSICPAVFSIKHRFKRHLKYHNRNYSNQYSFSAQTNANSVKSKTLQSVKRKLYLDESSSLSKSLICSKCPAKFTSQVKYSRHLELHGKHNNFTCRYCDFSVRNAVNIQRHEKVHKVRRNSEIQDFPVYSENLNGGDKAEQPISIENVTDEKKLYICDRCPYNSGNKTAVQSHQRSHWMKQNFDCPHCDYSSVKRTSLHSHLNLHLQGSKLYPPEAFIKFQSFKIVIQEENGEKLVFDDETMVNEDKSGSQNDLPRMATQSIQNNLTICSEQEKIMNRNNDADNKSVPALRSRPKNKPIVVLTDIFHKNTIPSTVES